MLRMLRPFAVHLRGRGRALGVLFLLGLVASAVSLATPLVGKAFIDAVATRKDFGAVPAIAGALAALAVIDLLLGVVTRWAHARLSAHVLVDLRRRLFERCLHAPLEHLEGFRQGDLLTRFGSDLPRIQGLLVDGVLGAVQNAMFLAVAAAVLLRLCVPLAAWSFAGLAVALVATVAFRGPVEAGARRIQEAMADVGHFLAERLGFLRPLRLHGAQDREEETFSGLNDALVRRVLGFQALDAAATGLPALALTLSLAWIYLLGGRLLEAGELSLGTFVAFVLYQGRLYGPARGLLGLVRSLQEVRVSLGRVAEVLGDGRETLGVPTATPRRGEVRLEGVTFAYPGKPPVLRRLDLSLEPGEKVAVLGPSGCGKSTLVQLLFGLRAPLAGSVRVGGLDGSSPDALRSVLGYAGAEPFLLHASVEENLAYGSRGAGEGPLLRAARLARAHEFVLSLPHGYRTVVGGRGLSLSDGQRQRIGLARLFLQEPDVLVLDEAFSALDPETEAAIRTNLRREFPTRTAIVITHRLGGLEEFDRVLLMRDGRLWPVTASQARTAMGGDPAPTPEADGDGPSPDVRPAREKGHP